MLIWGQNDRTFIPEFIAGLKDYANQPRIEILQGIGHGPQVEAPNKVTELIRGFLVSN